MQPLPHSSRCSSKVRMDGASSSGGRNLGEIKCNHGLKANLEVCKRGTNVGKVFLGCPLWKTNPCGFFRWVPYPDNGNATSSSDGNNEEKGKEPGDELGRLEAKLMRMKVKKQRLSAENGNLKNKLQQVMIERDILIERERVVSRVLYLSWMVFSFVLLAFVIKNFL